MLFNFFMYNNYFSCGITIHVVFIYINYFLISLRIYIFKLILSTHVIRVIPRPGEARDRYNKYARKL